MNGQRTGLMTLFPDRERRKMVWGIALPIIAIGFILYALYGRYAPGVLVHPGADWKGLVNHLYLTSQGIYGIAVGVVATYVFHFVLFGERLSADRPRPFDWDLHDSVQETIEDWLSERGLSLPLKTRMRLLRFFLSHYELIERLDSDFIHEQMKQVA